MTKKRRQNLLKKRRTNLFNKQVKSVVLGLEETKYKTTRWADLPLTVANMNHNTLAKVKLWEQGSSGGMVIFPQAAGTLQDKVQGREYYALGAKINLELTFPYDRMDTIVKLWYVPIRTGIPDPDVGEFFRQTLGNVMMDPRNMANYPYAKYLGMIRPRTQQHTFGTLASGTGILGGRNSTKMVQYYIPFNKTFKCRSNVGSDSMIDYDDIPNIPEKAFIVMTAYNEQGSTSLDQVVTNIEGVITFSFKDP